MDKDKTVLSYCTSNEFGDWEKPIKVVL